MRWASRALGGDLACANVVYDQLVEHHAMGDYVLVGYVHVAHASDARAGEYVVNTRLTRCSMATGYVDRCLSCWARMR